MDSLSGMSVEAIADKYGVLNQKKKAIEDEMDGLKSECLRRGVDHGCGDKYILTLSETTSKRLDTEAMRKDPKVSKLLSKFEKSSTSIRALVKPVPTVIEDDEE